MEYDVEYQQVVNVNIDEERFTLNLKGTLYNLEGVNGSAIIIPDMLISFLVGQTTNELDVSGFVDDNKAYVPLIIAENSIAEHIQTKCVYRTLDKKIVYYTDNTGKTVSGNTVILFPTGSDMETVSGLTNGQYYVTYDRSYSKSETDNLLAAKQGIIDSSHKLSADLVDDTSTTNKFVTASEKSAWNSKQDALTAGNNISIQDGVISATDTTYSAFTGADGTDAGTSGLVPAPAATDNTKYLKGDGSFSQIAYSEVSGTPSLSGYQTKDNLVTSVDSSSTDDQYPSAKWAYDTLGDIETLINAL